MGLFITLAEPTAPMKKEAASAGVLDPPFNSNATYNVGLLGESGRDWMRGRTAAWCHKQPFDSWSRTLPGSTIPAIAARVVTAGLFGVTAVGLVIVAAHLFAPPKLSAGIFARLLAVCGLNAIPAAFMGITLGYLASARVAVALANLIYLPLAYLGGLWVPPQALPPTINAISQWTPTRHMAELARNVVAGANLPTQSLAAVAVFTLLFASTAWLAAKRDAKRRFG